MLGVGWVGVVRGFVVVVGYVVWVVLCVFWVSFVV